MITLPTFQLRDATGLSIEAMKAQLTTTFVESDMGLVAGRVLDEVHLTFDVSLADWRVIDANQLFGTDRQLRSPCLGGDFNRGPVRLDARLDPTIRFELAINSAPSSAQEVADVLLHASGPPLLDVASWIALAATTSSGALRIGFQTVAGGYRPNQLPLR